MFTTGMTSVTFRNLSIDDVVDLAVRGNLETVEWGGDIHCPHGDVEKAQYAKRICSENGLSVNSYGSYYTLYQNEDVSREFNKVLDSAKALEAPIVRIWAGPYSSNTVTNDQRADMIKEAQYICDLAMNENIKIAFEYHNNSLTDCGESALQLIQEVGKENCYLYWQADFKKDYKTNYFDLLSVLDHILCIHVFSYNKGNIQTELSEKYAEWENIIRLLQNKSISLLLEFVKEDNIDVFLKDCKTLNILANK